jgi:hypothetical protein
MIARIFAALFAASVAIALVVGLDSTPAATPADTTPTVRSVTRGPAHFQKLPAPCKAVAHLPGYSAPTQEDALRGLVSGAEALRMLREAPLTRSQLAAECTAYLYQWSEDHPKAV